MRFKRLRLPNLNRWQRVSAIVAGIWLLACSLMTAHDFPTEANLRAGWIAASLRTLDGEKAAIDAADETCRTLAAASNYAASLMCIDDVLHMKYAYRDKLLGLVAYGEKQARDERLPDQLTAVARAIALWAVPSIGFYLFGVVVLRVYMRDDEPAYRPVEQSVARDVYRWPDRTRRKPRRP